MAKNTDTKITLHVKGEEILNAKMDTQTLDCTEFMELLENFAINAPFPEYDIETYIMEWGLEIKSKREN